jgi:inosine-uridine nucleoside N-ribohydrolase
MKPIGKLLFVLLCFTSAVNAEGRKIIIDTDPGVDDAVAIMLAFQSPEIEVIGLTTVFGNSDVATTTHNALLLCERAGKHLPVAQGSAHPLQIPKRPNPDFVHGVDALGNTSWPAPNVRPVAESAASFIVRNIMDNPHEITLVALGPLTNLAHALMQEPQIAQYVKEVVIFAGAIMTAGNCSPIAEANVWGDPHAADIVFAAPWPLTTMTLDASQKPLLTKQMLSRISGKNPRLGTFLEQINQFYIDFYLSNNPLLEGAKVHDSLTIAYLIDKKLFKVEQGTVCVVTEGIAEGATIFDKSGNPRFLPWYTRPSINVCIDCMPEGVIQLIEERLSHELF